MSLGGHWLDCPLIAVYVSLVMEVFYGHITNGIIPSLTFYFYIYTQCVSCLQDELIARLKGGRLDGEA